MEIDDDKLRELQRACWSMSYQGNGCAYKAMSEKLTEGELHILDCLIRSANIISAEYLKTKANEQKTARTN